jgi:superoxide dismutase, Cu-Zn family
MTIRIPVVTVALIACGTLACNREAGGTGAQTQAPANTQPVQAAPPPQPVVEDPGAETAQPVTKAVAVLTPTQGNNAHGTVTFTAHPGGGVDVKAEFSDLPKGKHAFHVHEFGDCSGPAGDTAGTHFNFQGSSEKPGDKIDRITGNLGELEAAADGKATTSTTVEKAALQGQYSILGRAVVVHEKGNDPKSPPMGATGGRIACGVIGIADADAARTAAVTGHMKKP